MVTTMRMTLGGALAATLVFVACSSSTPTQSDPNTASASIGSAGGSVATPDGEVQVTIPAGALSATTVITIMPGSSSVPGAIGPIWEIGPTGTQFTVPITIAIAYTDGSLSGQPVSNFPLSTVVANAWQPLSTQFVDTPSHTVSGQTTHLSPYALASITPTTNGDSGLPPTNDSGSPPTSDSGLPPNDSNCPGNVLLTTTPCVAGTFCSWPNSQYPGMGWMDYAYCVNGTSWEIFNLDNDNTVCPATRPIENLAANPCPLLQNPCQYFRNVPDCIDSCECGTINGVMAWHCYSNCDCAPSFNPQCAGEVPATNLLPGVSANNKCAVSIAGKTCYQGCIDSIKPQLCDGETSTCDGSVWNVTLSANGAGTGCP
jgi:hypothetical protein